MTILACDPVSWQNALKNAVDGDTIQLLPGNYGILIAVALRAFHSARPLTIDCSAAGVKLGGIRFDRALNIRLIAPRILGSGQSMRYGINIQFCTGITIQDADIRNCGRGAFVNESTRIAFSNCNITGMAVDGIDIAHSSFVSIVDCNIYAFAPPALGVHQDGVQAWKGCQNLVVSRCTIIGGMQGITDFGSTGDVNNVGTLVTGNKIEVSMFHGITLTSTDGATVTGNVVTRAPGFKGKTIIRVNDDAIACGNVCPQQPKPTATGVDVLKLCPVIAK